MSSTLQAAALLDPPVIGYDPYSDECLTDPYPFFEDLRKTPVAFIEAHGYYAVGRHEEAGIVANDHARFTTTAGVGLADIRKPGAWRAMSPITEVDPPEHTAVRAALQKILSPIVVRNWRAAFDAYAKIVAERVLDMREVDGVEHIAEDFVLGVFPQQLGIVAPKDRLMTIGQLNFNQTGPNNARLQAALARAQPIMDWYENHLQRDKMLPGGFGEQIYLAVDRGEFAPGTGPAHVRTFFRAGMDTTMAGIGFTLNQLARHPDQYDQVRADLKLTRNAFEEAIRHESPAQVMYRTTTADVELSGYRLRADTKVGYYIGAANRDPRRWAEPDRYDIQRDVIGAHRAFGVGSHVCIGQMIARLEAESVLSAIAARAKRIELNGEPAYRLINNLRTLDRLPLRITPA